MIWEIWWEWNKRIVREEKENIEAVLSLIESSVVEVALVYIKNTTKHLDVAGWDILMANNWKKFPYPSCSFIASGPKVVANRDDIRWIPLNVGVLKITLMDAQEETQGP